MVKRRKVPGILYRRKKEGEGKGEGLRPGVPVEIEIDSQFRIVRLWSKPDQKSPPRIWRP